MVSHSKDAGQQTATRTFKVVIFVMRVMSAEMRNVAQGTMYGQMAILQTIYARPMTQSALAEEVGVSGATMSSTINTLETRGWVLRERDAADRRVVWVKITLEGRSVLDTMSRQFEGKIAAALDTLSPVQHAALDSGLDALHLVFAHVLQQISADTHLTGAYDPQHPISADDSSDR